MLGTVVVRVRSRKLFGFGGETMGNGNRGSQGCIFLYLHIITQGAGLGSEEPIGASQLRLRNTSVLVIQRISNSLIISTLDLRHREWAARKFSNAYD